LPDVARSPIETGSTASPAELIDGGDANVHGPTSGMDERLGQCGALFTQPDSRFAHLSIGDAALSKPTAP